MFKEAPGGPEKGSEHRGKGVKEGGKERRRERGVVAMPANGWKGGAETRDHRKQKESGREGRKKGRTDSDFSTVAARVGCNPNPTLTTHFSSSHSSYFDTGGPTSATDQGLVSSNFFISGPR